MPKPQWLIDKEQHAERQLPDPDRCCDCLYYGPTVKFTKHRSGENVDVHLCDIHVNCFNTKFSICCDDFIREELV